MNHEDLELMEFFDFWWQGEWEGKGSEDQEAENIKVTKVERVRGAIVLAFKTTFYDGGVLAYKKVEKNSLI